MALTNKGRRTDEAFKQAARTVFEQKGYLRSTVTDIATAAGRSSASFYNYYDSKEALLTALAEQFREEVIGRALPSYTRGTAPEVIITESVRAYWTTYTEWRAEMLAIFQLAMVDETFAERWREIRATAVGTIIDGVMRAQKLGFAPGMNPRLMASILGSMIEQYCLMWLTQGGDALDVQFDERRAIAALANVWYRGVYWRTLGPVGSKPARQATPGAKPIKKGATRAAAPARARR